MAEAAFYLGVTHIRAGRYEAALQLDGASPRTQSGPHRDLEPDRGPPEAIGARPACSARRWKILCVAIL